MTEKKAIRDAINTLLAGATNAGANVFINRLTPLNDSELPAIKAYTPDSTVRRQELGANGARASDVALVLELVDAINPSSAVDGDEDTLLDRLEAIEDQVLALIDGDPTLGDIVSDTRHEGSVWGGADTEATSPVGVLTLTFRVDADSVSALKSGRLAVVTADGVAIGRLRSFSISTSLEPLDVSNAESSWRELLAAGGALNTWTASIDMTLDDGDAGQAKLAPGASLPFVFYPRGNAAGASQYSGTAIVVNVDENVSEDGDVIRSVSIDGSGPITGA